VLGSIDYAMWFLSASFEVSVVVCILRARSVKRYLSIVFYMLAEVLASSGRLFVLLRAGYSSHEYFYFYYYSDALLVICLYFALMGLYSQVFQEMQVSRYLRIAAILLLGVTAWFTYGVVADSRDRLLTHFVVELSQNLYFVGVVLTYLLWGAMMKLRETRTRLIQLVLSLGVCVSAFAATYALRNIYPAFSLWQYTPPLLAIALPAAWAYTFLRVTEDSRLATAQVVSPNR
jgi:hypothetical protein